VSEPDSETQAGPIEPASDPSEPPLPLKPSKAYSNYVLAVLTLVYVLNFLDRQIITILAEDIKADLGLTDAEIGFLYGTAFAVFYAVFGIPLGRLADVWNRRSLISIGIALWSIMTAASGFARSWTHLATARIGVGIGESSATPAAFSMLSDSFPARARATVLAIYSSGIYIGGGLGLLVGGQIVDRWNTAFPDGNAPFDLAGWQAAFLAVGLPGLLLAGWVRTLREPIRGAIDGATSEVEPHPFRAFFRELRAVFPGLTLIHLWLEGAGFINILRNILWAMALALMAWVLTQLTGNPLQWTALGIGIYCAVSWAHALRIRDRAAATLIFDTPSTRYLSLGFSLLAFGGYGFAGWVPVYFMRIHGETSSTVGLIIGISAVAAGVIGVPLGGYLADRMRARDPRGRIRFALGPAVLPVPLALAMLSANDATLAYAIYLPLGIVSSMWVGAGASTIQDLVLPRMRAIASAFYLLIIPFVGFAMGPFTVGLLSDSYGLPAALRFSLISNALAVVFLLLGSRHLERDEETMVRRAEAAEEAGR